MQRTLGFTIVELAVTMVVIAILLGSILVPLNTQVESRKYDETQRVLERAREALLGYVAANGYFPCPATSTSNGQEAPGFNHNPVPPQTSCPSTVGVAALSGVYYGFLPAARLGLTPTDSQGYALDAWGLAPYNRIRYAVSAVTVNDVVEPFTRINRLRVAGMANVVNCVQGAAAAVCDAPGGGAGLLYVCGSGVGATAANCGTAMKLTDNAVAVIWSSGPNAATASGGTSVDEAQNPNFKGGSADRIFVSKTKSGGPSDANEFDDVVTWIGSPILFNRLIQAGQLP